MSGQTDLVKAAKAVLDMNDRGSHTIPSSLLYPHQWFWDSCFIAIGISHYDIERAQQELLSLLRGQWSNGMIPNIIFAPNEDRSHIYHDASLWRSWLSPYSPDGVNTSGITQPPVLAEAIVQIGKKLPLAERRSWYRSVYPALLEYHKWIYEDRDPHGEGLALLIHPWESGTDNSPPWMSELNSHLMPWWIRAADKIKLTSLVGIFRRDTRSVPKDERPSNAEELAIYAAQRRLRRKAYNIKKILPHSLFAIEDLTFNSILIRGNQHLVDIAKSLRIELPEDLLDSMAKTEKALDELWDPYSNQYYSRNFINHELIKESSIATLMPLYTGIVDEEKANKIIKLLESKHSFGTPYPVPSAPVNSVWFKEMNYWQGPTWVNMNWLIIEGLKSNGFRAHAEALTEATLEMVAKSGMYEYFSALNGDPAGSDNFSWTAALTIDLSNQK